MLPFFILIWACINMMFERYEASQVVLNNSRTCAWFYADSSCNDNTLPEQCREKKRPGKTIDDKSGVENKLNEQVKSKKGMKSTGLGHIIGSIFGHFFEMGDSRAYRRPKYLGGGTGTLRGRHYLMCNEKTRDQRDTTKDTGREVSKSITGGSALPGW